MVLFMTLIGIITAGMTKGISIETTFSLLSAFVYITSLVITIYFKSNYGLGKQNIYSRIDEYGYSRDLKRMDKITKSQQRRQKRRQERRQQRQSPVYVQPTQQTQQPQYGPFPQTQGYGLQNN